MTTNRRDASLFGGLTGKTARVLHRTGFATVLCLLAAALVFYFLRGSVYREWINPFSVAGAGAFDPLDPGNLAVALIGTVGLPPLVVAASFGVLLWGWFLILFGLRQAGGVAAVPLLIVLALQQWLLSGMLPGGHLLLALLFGGGHLTCWLLARLGQTAWSRAASGVGHFLLLVGLGVLLFTAVPNRMALTLGVAAAQLITILLLIIYWFVLGYDALDGSITGGRRAGELGRRYLSERLFTPLVAGGLVLGGLYLLSRGGLLLPFGVALLIGNVFFVYSHRRHEPARIHTTGNMLVYSFLVFIVLLQGVSVFVPDLELLSLDFLIPPIILYVVTSIWGFLSSGPLFVGHPTAALPGDARRFLHIGWVVLSANCLLFFIAARDDTFMALSDRIGAEALLAVGLPVLLYLLVNRRVRVFPNGRSRVKKPVPRLVFVFLSLLILTGIQLTRGLSVYNFSRVTVSMAEGNAALRVGEYGQAFRHYQHASGVQPDNWKPLMMKGVIRNLQGRQKAALKLLGRTVALEPQALDGWLLLGAVYRQQKQYTKALAAYRHAVAIDPADSFSYRNMGLCYSYMDRHEAALRMIKKALQIMPGKNEFGTTHYAALGLVLLRAKRYLKAESALRKALRLTPRDHLALSDMGVLLARRGRHRESSRYLIRAHRVRPENREILEQLLRQFDRLQDRAGAVEALGLSARALPDNLELAQRYVRALLDTKNFVRASRALPSLLARFRDDPELLYLHARLSIEGKRYPQARKRLDRLLSKDAGHIEGLLQRAWLFRRQKNWQRARADYRRILRRDPDNGSALLFGGIVAVREFQDYSGGFRMLRRVFQGKKRNFKKRARITGLRYFALAAIRQKPPVLKPAIRAYRTILRALPRDFGSLSNLNIIYGATQDLLRQAGILRALIRHYPQRLLFRIQLALNLEKQGKGSDAVSVYTALQGRLEEIETATYEMIHRKSLKGYSREQMIAYCKNRIAALKGAGE